jgi:hypothetical protein
VTDQHEPGTTRYELVQTVYRTWVLNELLEDEVAEPVGRGIGGGLRSVSGGSRPPWTAQAAELVMDLHIQARQFESDFTYRVSGRWTERGPSSRNTWLALYRLTDLMEAVPDRNVLTALITLRGWSARAEVFLGQADPIRRLPREFGQSEQVCPWCSFRTLRCYTATGSVFCVNPTCRDADGQRPQASIEVNDIGDLSLLWQDGTRRIPEPFREEAA